MRCTLLSLLVLAAIGAVAALSSDNSFTVSLSSSDGAYSNLVIDSATSANPRTIYVEPGARVQPTASSYTYYKSPSFNVRNVEGTLPPSGEASATAFPPSFDGPFTWTDGALYMYGGQASIAGRSSKVWRFNREADQWQWLIGPELNSQDAVYGTRRVPHPDNTPGGRGYGASVVDSDGNFWLMGGQTQMHQMHQMHQTGGENRDYDDLWMLNTTSWEWAWYAGTGQTTFVTPVFSNAAKGVDFPAESAGMPAAAWGSTEMGGLFWSDLSKCLYIWGNYELRTNAMWRYCPSTDMIAWVHGSDDITGSVPTGVYPTSGLPDGTFADAHLPNQMHGFGSVSDSSNGLFYILGGSMLVAGPTTAISNQVWVFNSTANQWAWISGSPSEVPHVPAEYGAFRVSDPANVWSSRQYGSAAIDTAGGYIFYYGGYGTVGYHGDVGRFKIATKTWVWWAGSNEVNPTVNYPTTPTTPAVTTNGAGSEWNCVWVDGSGSVWYGFGDSTLGGDTNEVWTVPITVPTLTFDLTPATGATLNRAFKQLAVRPVSEGSNIVTLCSMGATRTFTWTIVSEDGTVGTPFTLHIVQRWGVADNTWSGTYTTPAGAGIAIDSETTSAGTTTIPLPASAAGGSASLALFLGSDWATISTTVGGSTSASLSPSIASLSVGSNTIAFTVTSLKGVAAGPYVFEFVVADASAVSSSSTGSAAVGSSGPVGGASSSTGGVGCPSLTCGAPSTAGSGLLAMASAVVVAFAAGAL